jgi:hypothetical protein
MLQLQFTSTLMPVGGVVSGVGPRWGTEEVGSKVDNGVASGNAGRAQARLLLVLITLLKRNLILLHLPSMHLLFFDR